MKNIIEKKVTKMNDLIGLKNLNTYSKNENIGEYEISVIWQP